MRDGAEYFTQPVPSAQRRYEAMRAYFVDDMPAAQVADRFGYSTASVHQMATLLRGGRMEFFAAAKPGPKGPRKAGQVHDRVLALRADGHSVTEIAAALHAEGTPVSAQTVWTILDAEGIGRLVRDDTGRRGTPARLDPVKATTLSPSSWPAGTHLPCDHAGLFLLLPAIVSLGLPDLIHAAAYPGTRALSAWQSIGTLLLAKCARRARTHHIDALTAPGPCSPSSPRTTPAPRWSTPTPTSPKPNRPARSSHSPTTGNRPPDQTPACSCSTPN